jgi:hypothetical protein
MSTNIPAGMNGTSQEGVRPADKRVEKALLQVLGSGRIASA